MDYKTFTRTAAERAGLPVDTVERVEHATLRTLADRISGGEAQDLASQLPSRLQDDLRPAREEAEAFGVDEFVRRVAQRGDVGPEEARTGAVAVLTTVREAVTQGEFDDGLSQLPQEYRDSWDRRPERTRHRGAARSGTAAGSGRRAGQMRGASS